MRLFNSSVVSGLLQSASICIHLRFKSAILNPEIYVLLYVLPFGRLRSRLLVCETDDHGKAVKIRRGRAAVMD